MTSTEIKGNQERFVPVNTLRQNQRAVNVFEKWCQEMKTIKHANTDHEKDVMRF